MQIEVSSVVWLLYLFLKRQDWFPVAMMGQPVQQRRRHLAITTDIAPLAKYQIGRDHHTGRFIQCVEQMAQQSSAGLTKRQIPQFIEDHPIDVTRTQGKTSLFALEFFLFQRIDQFDGRQETDTVLLLHRLDFNGNGTGRMSARRARTLPTYSPSGALDSRTRSTATQTTASRPWMRHGSQHLCHRPDAALTA